MLQCVNATMRELEKKINALQHSHIQLLLKSAQKNKKKPEIANISSLLTYE